MKKVSGIYEIAFPNGGIYIGASTHVLNRWGAHMASMRAGKARRRVQDAYNDAVAHGGTIAFRVVEKCEEAELPWSEHRHIRSIPQGKKLNDHRAGSYAAYPPARRKEIEANTAIYNLYKRFFSFVRSGRPIPLTQIQLWGVVMRKIRQYPSLAPEVLRSDYFVAMTEVCNRFGRKRKAA